MVVGGASGIWLTMKPGFFLGWIFADSLSRDLTTDARGWYDVREEPDFISNDELSLNITVA